ncbi:putative chromatin regulator PHD family [Helianthus annuus]|nr:putative chromatin regulator PHD family [Helianthus annuus]
MVDVERVCCMCGDVGFPDKIFRCIKCQHRFQHSYCSNYYNESSDPPEFCDWCQTEVTRTGKPGGSSKKTSSKTETGVSNRSEYSGPKIKQQDREEGSEKNKPWSSTGTGAPSPKTSTRRYKLLKDVMC